MKRRDFVKITLAGAAALPVIGCGKTSGTGSPDLQAQSPLFHVSGIPDQAVTAGNHHLGFDALVGLMAGHGLNFYRTAKPGTGNGSDGLIAANDVVLVKVNAQWKYRGCTNSDLVRGIIRSLLDHPDGFTGEVVILDNGQGRGSLNCDTSSAYGNSEVHANAENDQNSFLWLVNSLFADPRVSPFLLDPIGGTFIGAAEHVINGYRTLENVSYPCFTTAGGNRVELAEGVWNGSSYEARLKLINVPVLKHHDTGGAELTASLKHMYGLVSMSDGQSGFRHYGGLGETAGKMMTAVRTPVLNIIDAIWVSQGALEGYPASATFRANQIVAGQDPVALDYWAAKNILYPIDSNDRHSPAFSGVDAWLTAARDLINGRGGFSAQDQGVQVRYVTKTESEMSLYETVVS